jgi:hypothetical protein
MGMVGQRSTALYVSDFHAATLVTQRQFQPPPE